MRTLWVYLRKPEEKLGTQFSMFPDTVLTARLPVIKRRVCFEWLLRRQLKERIHYYNSWAETDASLQPGFRYFYPFGVEALSASLSLLCPILDIQDTGFYNFYSYVIKFTVVDFALVLANLPLWSWTFEHWCDEIEMNVCFTPEESLVAFHLQ